MGLRERPYALPGISQRINTGWGKVYVTVNEIEVDGGEDGEEPGHEPFEVFVTIGQSGGLFNAWAESLGKTISNSLRTSSEPRVTAEAIAEDLEGMRSDKVAEDNGDRIRSIPDAVGVAILRYLDNRADPPLPVRGDANPDGDDDGGEP